MVVFGEKYAAAYDTLYREKTYSDECDMIAALMTLAGPGPRTRLLDLGCGTGNHAIPLALRGHNVTGIDLSEAMLAIAREKAAAAGVSGAVDFHPGDVRNVTLEGVFFDAAIMMFAVLGYQRSDDDVRATLKTVRQHLAVGAPLLFDVWYGPGVLAERPGPRERIISRDGETVMRKSNSVLDEASHLCKVSFRVAVQRGDGMEDAFEEDHVMRFFFAEELAKFAAETGFEILTLRDFPDWQQKLTPQSWNAVAVLRAI